MTITTVGIDLAKNVFQIHGVETACAYEVAHRAAIEVHGQADRPDGLAVATSANDL